MEHRAARPRTHRRRTRPTQSPLPVGAVAIATMSERSSTTVPIAVGVALGCDVAELVDRAVAEVVGRCARCRLRCRPPTDTDPQRSSAASRAARTMSGVIGGRSRALTRGRRRSNARRHRLDRRSGSRPTPRSGPGGWRPGANDAVWVAGDRVVVDVGVRAPGRLIHDRSGERDRDAAALSRIVGTSDGHEDNVPAAPCSLIRPAGSRTRRPASARRRQPAARSPRRRAPRRRAPSRRRRATGGPREAGA